MNRKQLETGLLGILFSGGCLVLALMLSSYINLQVPLVTSKGAESLGLAQNTSIYLPVIVRNFPVFYVDSINGSNTNPGTSEAKPWKTLSPVNAKKFVPGSVIHFKRGSSWTGELKIDDSGVPGNPIVFTAYGEGDRPVIRNPGGQGNNTRAIEITADWVIVENLLLRDVQESAIFLVKGADHNVIRDVEITNAGIGIRIHSDHNLFTRNYIHDLHMITNTPGGDDDWGAYGIGVGGSFNEISYNNLIRCISPSYDYGVDGGGIEVGGPLEGAYIHHNWVADSAGFLEANYGLIKNSTVAYNVSINNERFALFIISGPYAGMLENFRVENNTIIETKRDEWRSEVLHFSATPELNMVILRNNILYVENFQSVFRPGFTHDHNLYYLGAGSALGFTLGEGEKIADPLFVNLAGQDLHLQSGSPAIDAGVNLGYSLDFESLPVPVGAAPDLGAFEYRGTPGPTPTPNPNEIIIDDTDPRFSTSFVQDAWQEYVQPGGQHYGDSHHYNSQIGTGLDIATWSFTVPVPGRYQVYAWWWDGSYRPTDVPYTISALSGSVIISSTTVRVNQQTNGGQWNLLSTFDFQDQGSIMVSDDASSGQDIVADAVRLVYLAPLASANLASTAALGPACTPTPTPVSPIATPTPANAR